MNKKRIAIAAVIILVIAVGAGYLAWDYGRNKSFEVDFWEEGVSHTEYKNVKYEGKNYTFNPRIDTLLYIGVDTASGISEGEVGQADTIILFVLNKDTKVLTAINLSRDTMTDVRSYDVGGKLLGTVKQHLGYAYTFAGGGKKSCQSVAWSVSNVLHGIPIEEYCATDVGSITLINDLVGGVEVLVPNDDLADMFEDMKAGSRVLLTDENVEKFVRYRDVTLDFSNNGRRERQKAYLNAYMPKLSECLKNDINGMWDRFNSIENDTVTSVNRNEYLDMVSNFLNMDFDKIDFYSPDGEDKLGDKHDEFYIDDDELMVKILDIFYVCN